MDEVQARHRKELKDLQSRIAQRKKQASKKTRKGVNDECDRLEAELKQRQADEVAALNGPSTDENDQTVSIAEDIQDLNLSKDEQQSAQNGTDSTQQTPEDATETSSATRKPNRQKARLARRAAEQEEIARQAAEEAENLPDMKQQERERMLEYMKERKLQEKEIRADGHCLYSAVADQLSILGIPLSSNDGDSAPPYKATRTAAADYIEQHHDDFAAFMDEPLPQYVHKIRDTAEWGGQLELQALAKSYDVEINVLQDFGRVEKIEPNTKAGEKSIWLGYYKHGFGLGEHYNSLRKAAG